MAVTETPFDNLQKRVSFGILCASRRSAHRRELALTIQELRAGHEFDICQQSYDYNVEKEASCWFESPVLLVCS
ncbi:hypothetical protein EYF80_045394 [Liparis tanakae]|uniref:Uncharacterized protein n=1 Tax=Liparis tanakae TaxID=230148 RepID=A0A4Z2FTR4_9TELE|nr:hypothetical protein EYF80_045394 [Liparis tanakae]